MAARRAASPTSDLPPSKNPSSFLRARKAKNHPLRSHPQTAKSLIVNPAAKAFF
jgi:hypothetical protein